MKNSPVELTESECRARVQKHSPFKPTESNSRFDTYQKIWAIIKRLLTTDAWESSEAGVELTLSTPKILKKTLEDKDGAAYIITFLNRQPQLADTIFNDPKITKSLATTEDAWMFRLIEVIRKHPSVFYSLLKSQEMIYSVSHQALSSYYDLTEVLKTKFDVEVEDLRENITQFYSRMEDLGLEGLKFEMAVVLCDFLVDLKEQLVDADLPGGLKDELVKR